MTEPGAEAVHTVEDYFDVPRAGYADFQGRPHAYQSVFDEAADAYSGKFLLRPASAEEFGAAIELWSIWLRWEAAFHSGQADLSSRPSLATDTPRRQILIAERQRLIEASKAPAFEVGGRMFLHRASTWRVVWTQVP